jgi:hypothetical protein
MTTPRNQAASLVMPKPDPESQEAPQGNPLLMEATFLELVSSIRALHRSNGELEEALKKDPDDLDFSLAVKENKYIILRKREETLQLVVDMRRMGASIDVPEDILDMKLDMTPTQQPNTPSPLPPLEETPLEEEQAGVYL